MHWEDHVWYHKARIVFSTLIEGHGAADVLKEEVREQGFGGAPGIRNRLRQREGLTQQLPVLEVRVIHSLYV